MELPETRGGGGAMCDAECGAPLLQAHSRVYYIDWMRVVAIYLVVTYHVVQGLDWVGFFDHIPGFKALVVSFRAAALQIGMPMFFHISGRAQALSPTIGLRKRLRKGFQRLLLPFAVCYLMLIPPWQYIDKEYDWDHPDSFHMKTGPFKWLFEYYTTSKLLIYFDMAWLWFLPALFLIMLLSAPLLLLSERPEAMPRGGRFCGQSKKRLYSVVTVLFWAGLMLGLVLIGFTWSFGFFAVLGPVGGVIIAQYVPLPPHGSSPDDGEDEFAPWCAVRLHTLLHILSSVGLVLSFGYEEIDPPQASGGHSLKAGVPFLVLCTGFYVQGYFSQRWSQACRELDNGASPPKWVLLYRLVAAFMVLLVFMVSSPVGDVEDGHFIYPIYSTSYKRGSGFGAFYVLGTWCYIAVFVSLFQTYGDSKIDDWLYKHATKSTLVVYIFHWLFLKVFAFWILKPVLHSNGGVKAATVAAIVLAVAFALTVGGSLLVYVLLVRGCPRFGTLFGI